MDNSIIVKPSSDIQKDMDDSSVKYTPFLVLLNAKSGKITSGENPEMVPWINKICIVENGEYSLLGDSVDCCYLASRMRASEYKGGEFTSVFSNTNTGSDVDQYSAFREKARAFVQGYKFGPEFLVWIPSVEKFSTLWVGDNQGRAKAGKPILDLASSESYGFTLYSEVFSGKKVNYPRHILKARRCDDPALFEIQPNQEDAASELERFSNPPQFDFDEAENLR